MSIIRSFLLYTQQWYMSYRFADSCQQTCMTYTNVVCTAKNSWWWTEELSETRGVLFQNKFEKLVYLVGFIIIIYILLFIEYNGDVSPDIIKCYWMLPIHASQLVSDNKDDFIHDPQSLMPCFWLNTIIHSRIIVWFASKRCCNLWKWSGLRLSSCEIIHTCGLCYTTRPGNFTFTCTWPSLHCCRNSISSLYTCSSGPALGRGKELI